MPDAFGNPTAGDAHTDAFGQPLPTPVGYASWQQYDADQKRYAATAKAAAVPVVGPPENFGAPETPEQHAAKWIRNYDNRNGEGAYTESLRNPPLAPFDALMQRLSSNEGGIPADVQKQLEASFATTAYQQQQRQTNEVARDSARRGLLTSGQVTALQRDISNRTGQAIQGYHGQLGFQSAQMGLQAKLAALNAYGQKYGYDKNYDIAMRRLQAEADQGSGQFLGGLLTLGGTILGGVLGGPIGAGIGGAIGGAGGAAIASGGSHGYAANSPMNWSPEQWQAYQTDAKGYQ